MRTPVEFLSFTLLLSIAALCQQGDHPGSAIIHVATALNHLTVLEFHEPVTMAAAGSADFQIERESNKVFVKPIKSGAATDLFVWTASRRFAYELEITQEVKNMNFAIDSAQPDPPTKPPATADMDQLADVALARALLGAEEIDQKGVRKTKNQVSVRVEQVFYTQSTVYIQYEVKNNTSSSYHLNMPQAYELKVDDSSIALGSLSHTQLDRNTVERVGETRGSVLPVTSVEDEIKDLHPGEVAHGVVPIRQNLRSPAMVQLVFSEGVKATFVF